jgi:hypothetical protein
MLLICEKYYHWSRCSIILMRRALILPRNGIWLSFAVSTLFLGNKLLNYAVFFAKRDSLKRLTDEPICPGAQLYLGNKLKSSQLSAKPINSERNHITISTFLLLSLFSGHLPPLRPPPRSQFASAPAIPDPTHPRWRGDPPLSCATSSPPPPRRCRSRATAAARAAP